MTKVAIIGSGPAGLMSAIAIGKRSDIDVTIFERNNTVAKKLLLTGNGRCNLTSTLEVSEMIDKYYGKGKFLFSAFYKFSNQDLMDFFTNAGVFLKNEGDKVYPASNKANDIKTALLEKVLKQRTKVVYETLIEKVTYNDKYYVNNQEFDLLILSTGGLSYPETGSNGIGYSLAKALGHKIISPEPALVPLKTDIYKELQGLSLNVDLDFVIDGKKVGSSKGGIIFTHFGISGPAVLDISYYFKSSKLNQIIVIKMFEKSELLSKLDTLIKNNQSKNLSSVLNYLIPRRLTEYLFSSELLQKNTANVSNKELDSVIEALTDLRINVFDRLGFDQAMITKGGIPLEEINPKSMMSLKSDNLFIIGEMLDIVGQTGGYNLQLAFSTGYVAGEYITSNY